MRFCSNRARDILRHLLDEEAHLRLRWLIIGLQAIHAEPFGRARADGADHRRAKAFMERLGVSHALRHEKEMRNLCRRS